MKTISLCILVLILSFFVCCTTDDIFIVETTTRSKEFQEKNTNMYLKNLDPYDTLGNFQNSILETYIVQDHYHATLGSIFEQVKLITENLSNTEYTGGLVPLENLTYMVNYPETSLDTFIENSNLTDIAKTSFSNFAISLSVIESSDDDTFYSTIINYEQSVKADINLTSADSESILTTTTLLKYSSIFRKKRRKDKDWEVSVGNKNNISAKFQGTVAYDDITAVIMSVTMEIYLNINH